MGKAFKAFVIAVAILATSETASLAQNFSCSFGKRAACLDYGDQVCSSTAKCVDQSASCFDAYQCNYEGFTCKSNVSEIIDKYDTLVKKYNSLLDDNRTLVDDFNGLVRTKNSLIVNVSNLEDEMDTMRSCIRYSSSHEEARSCIN